MNRKSILVVDNDAASTRYVSILLGSLGYDASTLNNSTLLLPMLLLRQVEKRPYDLVLLNTNMPDGLAILEKINANPIFGNVNIIAMTAELDLGRPAQRPIRGVSDHIPKPINEALLGEKVRAALSDGHHGAARVSI